MFTNTKDFDAAIIDILQTVMADSYNFESVAEKYGTDSLEEAMAKCVDDGLVRGYSYERDEEGAVFTRNNPRITYEGLKFIERHA